jgi:hypothetical protein
MMTDTPEDWVLIEAAKRGDWCKGLSAFHLRNLYRNPAAKGYRALCDMIAKHEQKPVDRKLLCAREAAAEHGYYAEDWAEKTCIRAIELWEEGFGK